MFVLLQFLAGLAFSYYTDACLLSLPYRLLFSLAILQNYFITRMRFFFYTQQYIVCMLLVVSVSTPESHLPDICNNVLYQNSQSCQVDIMDWQTHCIVCTTTLYFAILPQWVQDQVLSQSSMYFLVPKNIKNNRKLVLFLPCII